MGELYHVSDNNSVRDITCAIPIPTDYPIPSWLKNPAAAAPEPHFYGEVTTQKKSFWKTESPRFDRNRSCHGSLSLNWRERLDPKTGKEVAVFQPKTFVSFNLRTKRLEMSAVLCQVTVTSARIAVTFHNGWNFRSLSIYSERKYQLMAVCLYNLKQAPSS